MSTITNTIAPSIGHATTSTADRAVRGKGLFARLYDVVIALRVRQGEAYVARQLADMTDHRLRDIGFDAGEIAEMRATRRLPARFGRSRRD